MAYSFELLTEDCSPKYIRQTIEELEANLSDGWPCWAIGNHDVQRVASRWNQTDKSKANPAQVNMFNAMLASLRGSVCSYQGEELGLVEAELTFEQLQDPYGITFWPNFKGRDGCRTPMPWHAQAEHGGFSEAKSPWLPVVDSQLVSAVDAQQDKADSMLTHYQGFMAWRKQVPELRYGDIEFLDANEQVLAFVREYEGEKVLAVFNFADNTQTFNLANNISVQQLEGHGFAPVQISEHVLSLPAYGVAYFRCQLN